MGSQTCCAAQDDQSKFDQQEQIPISIPFPLQTMQKPKLHKTIENNLKLKKPLENELNEIKEINLIKFGQDIYQGSVSNNGKPYGYGKLYRKDGSLLISNFIDGVANGRAYFIKENGNFYDGQLINNKANTQNGNYENPQKGIKYSGGFKDNQFHGYGRQQGPNHVFEGTYQNGKRIQGKLEWGEPQFSETQRFQYEGSFDENQQFTGKGCLKDSKGDYSGQFKDGKKDGQGVFMYKTNLKYEGSYSNGIKHGEGILYSQQNVAYKGNFANGMPHGIGSVVSAGELIQTKWENGIDVKLLNNDD